MLLIYFNKLENTLLILLLFLGNPQVTIYHKYYDPLLLILFLTLFNLNINFNNIFKKTNIILIYLYFSMFLLLNIVKW